MINITFPKEIKGKRIISRNQNKKHTFDPKDKTLRSVLSYYPLFIFLFKKKISFHISSYELLLLYLFFIDKISSVFYYFPILTNQQYEGILNEETNIFISEITTAFVWKLGIGIGNWNEGMGMG